MKFKNNTVLIGKSALFCLFFLYTSLIICRSVHARLAFPFKYFTDGHSPVRHSLKRLSLWSCSFVFLLRLENVTNTSCHSYISEVTRRKVYVQPPQGLGDVTCFGVRTWTGQIYSGSASGRCLWRLSVVQGSWSEGLDSSNGLGKKAIIQEGRLISTWNLELKHAVSGIPWFPWFPYKDRATFTLPSHLL